MGKRSWEKGAWGENRGIVEILENEIGRIVRIGEGEKNTRYFGLISTHTQKK